MSNAPSKAEIEALAKRHGATSYRNRADTQNPAFGFSEAGLASLLAEVRKQDHHRSPCVAGGQGMSHDEIMAMAREAGFRTGQINLSNGPPVPFIAPASGTNCMVELERFAALVAAAEREACAQVCANEEALALYNFDNDLEANRPFWNGGSQIATICEASIRARSKP